MSPPFRLIGFLLGLFAASLAVMDLDFTLAGQTAIPADLLFVPVLLIAIVAGYKEGHGWDRFDTVLSLYLGAFIVAALACVNPAFGLRQCLKIAYLVAIAAAVARLARDSNRAWALQFGFSLGVGLAVLSVLLGMLYYFAGGTSEAANFALHHAGSLPVWVRPRMDGTFLSPNLLCNYLIVGLALIPRRWWAVIVLGSLPTFSSGLGGIALMLSLSHRRRAALGLGVLLALGLLVLNTFSYPDAREGRLALSHRARCWVAAGVDWAAHPFTGIGPGQNTIAVTYTTPSGHFQTLRDAHNTVLSLLSQTGLLGLLAFMAVLLVALKENYASPLGIAVLCAIGYHGLTGSFEDARHLWFALGLLWAGVTPLEANLRQIPK